MNICCDCCYVEYDHCILAQFLIGQEGNDMDVNQHKRLSNITFRHKLKQSNSTFIDVLHFTVIYCLTCFYDVG